MAHQQLRRLAPFVCSSCKSIAPRNTPTMTSFIRPASTSFSKPPALDNLLNLKSNATRLTPSTPFADILDTDPDSMPPSADPQVADRLNYTPPHRLHVFATKHNTHMTLTAPPAKKQKREVADLYKPPEPNKPLMTYATGMIGFRKSGRGTYDAAFQLASYVLKQIQERGLLRDIVELEVVLRGFGSGREAVTKVLLGQEGRFIRPKIVAVTDATRLKFGGSRSPNPRRLG